MSGSQDGGKHAKPGGSSIGPKPSSDSSRPQPAPKHGGKKDDGK